MATTVDSILKYIQDHKEMSADFDYLCTAAANITNIKYGSDGSYGNITGVLPFNNKVALIDKLFPQIAQSNATYYDDHSIAQWIIYNLMNIIFISALCQKLETKILENHSIATFGSRYSCAYIWFEKGSLMASFVLWGNNKQNAYEERILYILKFNNFNKFPGGNSNNVPNIPFQIRAISNKTHHAKSADVAWSSSLFGIIGGLAFITQR